MEKTSMKQLIESTALVTKTTQKQTEETVRAFIEELKLALCKGSAVTIQGFGTVKPVHRKARKGHNPSTGEAINIPEHDTVTFSTARTFKDVLNG